MTPRIPMDVSTGMSMFLILDKQCSLTNHGIKVWVKFGQPRLPWNIDQYTGYFGSIARNTCNQCTTWYVLTWERIVWRRIWNQASVSQDKGFLSHWNRNWYFYVESYWKWNGYRRGKRIFDKRDIGEDMNTRLIREARAYAVDKHTIFTFPSSSLYSTVIQLTCCVSSNSSTS